jgi:hypothetical protein
MRQQHTRYIGLDSQCLSYLLDSIAGINEPQDALAEEKKALLRIWFYQPGTFILGETVISEVAYLQRAHPKPDDCRILAEAEELKLNFLLTYDHDFWRRLSAISSTTKLMKPSSYWSTLGILKGAAPVTVPHPTNPLSRQSWWRW